MLQQAKKNLLNWSSLLSSPNESPLQKIAHNEGSECGLALHVALHLAAHLFWFHAIIWWRNHFSSGYKVPIMVCRHFIYNGGIYRLTSLVGTKTNHVSMIKWHTKHNMKTHMCISWFFLLWRNKGNSSARFKFSFDLKLPKAQQTKGSTAFVELIWIWA